MVPKRSPAHFAMIPLTLLLAVGLVIAFRSPIQNHPVARTAAAAGILLILALSLYRLASPPPPRQLRSGLENADSLRVAEWTRLAEFLTEQTETGNIAILGVSGRDPTLRTLQRRRTFPGTLHVRELEPASESVDEREEPDTSINLPGLPWDSIDWVVVCHRHRDVLQSLRRNPATRDLRKAVLFVDDIRQAKHWVDSGLADVAVLYEMPPDLHRTLRAGGVLSAADAAALFHVYPPDATPDRR